MQFKLRIYVINPDLDADPTKSLRHKLPGPGEPTGPTHVFHNNLAKFKYLFTNHSHDLINLYRIMAPVAF